MKREEVASWKGLAAALALHSIHPVSKAVAAFGADCAVVWDVVSIEEVSGKGLRAQVKSKEDSSSNSLMWVRLGSSSFTGAVNLTVASQAVYLAQEAEHGAVLPLAIFELDEVLRAEAAFVVRELQASGISVKLMSGDGLQAVTNIAKTVGIAHAHSQYSPEDKLAHMRALQEQGGKVAMVGDGLNDGPVLAGADVSFAFGRAVPLAQAQSDFVVLSDDLQWVLRAVLLARKTLRIVRQNLAWSAAYNAVSVPLALLGLMPAWLAGLGMALSSLLVVLNASRLAQKLPANVEESSTHHTPATQPAAALQSQ